MTTNDFNALVAEQNTLARKLGNPEYVSGDERRFLTATAAALRDAEKRIGDKSSAAKNFCSVTAGQIEAAVKAELAPSGSLPAKLLGKYHANKCTTAGDALMGRIEQLASDDGLAVAKLTKLRTDFVSAITAASAPVIEIHKESNAGPIALMISIIEDAIRLFGANLDETRAKMRIEQLKAIQETGAYLLKEGSVGQILISGYPCLYADGELGGVLRDLGVVTPTNFEFHTIARGAWPFEMSDASTIEKADAFIDKWSDRYELAVQAIRYHGIHDAPDAEDYEDATVKAWRTPEAIEPAKRHMTPAARKRLLASLPAMSETDVMRMVQAGEISNEEAHGRCAGAGWKTHRGCNQQLGDARNWGERFKIRPSTFGVWFDGSPLPPPVSSYPSAGVLPYGKWTTSHGTEVLFDRSYTPLWERTPDGVVKQAKNQWVYFSSEAPIYDDCCPPRNNVSTLERCIDALAQWGLPTTPEALPPFSDGEDADDQGVEALELPTEQPEMRV